MSQEHSDIVPSPDTPFLPEKPQENIKRELEIRNSLTEQGVEREIADAVMGYKPEDVPFIYQSEPHDVLHHRVRDNWTEGYELIPSKSALWIGTTDAIHNLVNEGDWNDQIPEVIAQWRGSFVTESEQQEETTSITRTEAKQLGDGRFVLVEYKDVSSMGDFDGSISRISLYVPKEKFIPGGYSSERNSYQIYEFRRNHKLGMEGVPGGYLARKDEEQHEWNLDTSYSNVSGTTILNGYQEMLNFHMPDLSPLKEDYDNAYRFNTLPEPELPALLPGSPEQQFQMILDEETALTRDEVLELYPEAEELMRIIAPQALARLAEGGYQREAVQMSTDGILNHPDKIWVLDRMLEEFPREKRFGLARALAKTIKDGHLTIWARTLQEPKNEKFINDVINRNTRHLLSWFKRNAPVGEDLKGWIEKARVAAGTNPLHSPEYQKVFDGMITSYIERFIEYFGQQYLGNTLE